MPSNGNDNGNGKDDDRQLSLFDERQAWWQEADAARGRTPVIQPSWGSDELLVDAQVRLEDGIDDGMACPCCGRLMKITKRSLYYKQVRWLFWICRAWLDLGGGDSWVEANKGPQKGGDYAKLEYWGMVRRCPRNDDPKKRSSGLWQPTAKGFEFLRGELRVPSFCMTVKSKGQKRAEPRSWSTEYVNARELVGTRFDYQDAMSRIDWSLVVPA
jgi:hypothetical protein